MVDTVILVYDWPIYKQIFSFEINMPIGAKLYRNHV